MSQCTRGPASICGWFMALLLATLVAGCGGNSGGVSGVSGGGGGGGSTDTTAPTVSSTVPAQLATDVAINTSVSATFSEEMNPFSITNTTFTLKQGATDVAGAVTLVGTTATFNPTNNLATNTTYTATVTTAAKDLAGNPLASDYVWTFTTGIATDVSAPSVSSTVPVNSATGVAIGENITVTFNEPIDSATITTANFTVTQGGAVVPGAVTLAGTTATFNPTDNLATNATYTATVATGVQDMAGNPLASDYVWSFSTGTMADNVAPTVNSTLPLNGATGVAVSENIGITFSEAMDPATITSVAITLSQGGAGVSGAVASTSATTASFNPANDLAANTTYTATVTTAVQDLAGNALASDHVWTFTTAAASPVARQPVALGLAGNFAILAKSGISTVPSSAVTGDIGVSPIAGTAITGFSVTMDATNTFSTSTQVTGRIYAADYTPPTPSNMTTAVSNMETAYADAAGRTLPDSIDAGSGEIGGQTIFPGLHKWGSGVLISQDVTLEGGPNDVWIFQISGNLTQATATNVFLTGGALAKNVFWQVAGTVAIRANAHFEGIILSQTGIALETGASVNGRLLAQTAVTLDQNAVTQPAP